MWYWNRWAAVPRIQFAWGERANATDEGLGFILRQALGVVVRVLRAQAAGRQSRSQNTRQDVEMHDVTAVRPLENVALQVRFNDGTEGRVDVSKLVRLQGVFAQLRDPEFFRQVSVNEELGCVCWPNGADLDSDVLYSTITGALLPGQTSTIST
jgi:hypothetical protein